VLEAYDRFIGLLLGDLAVDGCITKALAGARKQAGARWTGENKASSARRSWTDVASRSAS
jgi:hypothetical protein